LIAALLPLLLTGCPLPILGPPEAQPRVEGEWIGRLVVVKVFDREGRQYDAVALDVLKGPKGFETPEPHLGYPMVESFPKALGPAWTGRTPLLVTDEPGPRIIPPDRAPVGRTVSVSGLMMMYSASSPTGSLGIVVRATPRHPSESSGWKEQVLIVNGPIRPISE